MKTCSKCDDPIEPGQPLLNALDRDWHKDCFVCAACDKPFTSGAFMMGGDDGNSPMHEDCLMSHETATAKKCGNCRKPLLPGQPILKVGGSKGLEYHQGCFTCAKCKGGFDGTSFVNDGSGKAFHAECIENDDSDDGTDLKKAAATAMKSSDDGCQHCGKEIEGARKFVPGMGHFHPNCFVCDTCDEPFSGKRYYVHPKTEKPMCETCMKKL